jgi:7-carboxy-7-deazaguanine synthase
MLISEIYTSRQGEGRLTGTPSVFVRTSGCNLRCVFCDTPFTSWEPTGVPRSVDEICSQVNAVADGSLHVVVTGGEPMLPREINELCEKISADGFHITIETAGTLYRELVCDLMSISPKLANSDPSAGRAGEWSKKHRLSRNRPNVVRQFLANYDCQLKFVVDSPDDIQEILDYVSLIEPPELSSVMLMPQGIETEELARRSQWLEPLSAEHGFTFCPRRHIEWYGNTRGT